MSLLLKISYYISKKIKLEYEKVGKVCNYLLDIHKLTLDLLKDRRYRSVGFMQVIFKLSIF